MARIPIIMQPHGQVQGILQDKNYRLAKRFFPFSVLRRRLQLLIADWLGESEPGGRRMKGGRI